MVIHAFGNTCLHACIRKGWDGMGRVGSLGIRGAIDHTKPLGGSPLEDAAAGRVRDLNATAAVGSSAGDTLEPLADQAVTHMQIWVVERRMVQMQKRWFSNATFSIGSCEVTTSSLHHRKGPKMQPATRTQITPCELGSWCPGAFERHSLPNLKSDVSLSGLVRATPRPRLISVRLSELFFNTCPHHLPSGKY